MDEPRWWWQGWELDRAIRVIIFAVPAAMILAAIVATVIDQILGG